jgi:hypothetical protein
VDATTAGAASDWAAEWPVGSVVDDEIAATGAGSSSAFFSAGSDAGTLLSSVNVDVDPSGALRNSAAKASEPVIRALVSSDVAEHGETGITDFPPQRGRDCSSSKRSSDPRQRGVSTIFAAGARNASICGSSGRFARAAAPSSKVGSIQRISRRDTSCHGCESATRKCSARSVTWDVCTPLPAHLSSGSSETGTERNAAMEGAAVSLPAKIRLSVMTVGGPVFASAPFKSDWVPDASRYTRLVVVLTEATHNVTMP